MGKCSVCKKKIEYNQYKVIGGIVYCLGCVSKKEAEEIAEALAKTVKDSAVKFDEFVKSMDEVTEMAIAADTASEPEEQTEPEKKPKKKRGRKKQ